MCVWVTFPPMKTLSECSHPISIQQRLHYFHIYLTSPVLNQWEVACMRMPLHPFRFDQWKCQDMVMCSRVVGHFQTTMSTGSRLHFFLGGGDWTIRMFWELKSVLITSCVSCCNCFVKQLQEMPTSVLIPLSKSLIGCKDTMTAMWPFL